MASTFKDLAGRQWSILLTVGDNRRVKAAIGVSIPHLHDDGMKPLAKLLSDEEAFVDLLFEQLRPHAEKAGVDAMAFASALDGNVIRDAHAAFLEALADFIPSLEARERFRGMMDKIRAGATEAEKSLLKEVQSINPVELAEKMVKEVKRQASLATT